MGKFVVHGVLVEQPIKSTTSNGIDCVTLLVEEKVRTAYNKEIINVYSVNFMGKMVNCVPDNVRLIGAPVVVTGTIRSREYKGKYYNDLSGDGLTIIDTGSFVSNSAPMPTERIEEVPVIHGSNLDNVQIEDDDLPF